MDNFWTNVYGQVRIWWQTIGVFIVTNICYYLVEHDSTDWTWKGLLVSAATAFLTFGLTKRDHKKTVKAVKHAVEETVITTQEVLEKEGKLK